jgi:glycosyltransferase involved in cell wall biosynthesis
MVALSTNASARDVPSVLMQRTKIDRGGAIRILTVGAFPVPLPAERGASAGNPSHAPASIAAMRVLHVISGIDPRSGGPSAALAGLLPAQVKAGIDVTVAATHSESFDRSIATALERAGVNVKLIGPTRGALKGHRDIRPRLSRLVPDVDVVHIHGLWEEIQHEAAKTARDRAKPYVMTPHGMLTPWSLAQSRLRKRLYLLWRLRAHLDGASAIHYTTPMERDLSASLRLRAPAIVQTLGVDLAEFATLPERGSFRRQFPAIGERRLIVFLGRIHPGKGLEYLVPALASMAHRHVTLAVVGPDSDGYQTAIEALAATHGVQDRVVFTGMMRGAARVAALVDADVFCLPSDHENFGVVVVEALAAGTPVVVSDHVAICGEVRAGGVGSVVPTGVKALAPELDRWFSDDVLRQQAAERARPFVWERYDWQPIGRQWVAHYTRLLASSAEHRRAGCNV